MPKLISTEMSAAIKEQFSADPGLVKLKKGTQIKVDNRVFTLEYSILRDDHNNMYALIEELGKGSFGDVKLAENIITGERVAIKIQHAMTIEEEEQQHFEALLLGEENFMKMFNRLLGSAQRMGQPRKGRHVENLNIGEEVKKFYTIQPLLTGKDLTKFIAQNNVFPVMQDPVWVHHEHASQHQSYVGSVLVKSVVDDQPKQWEMAPPEDELSEIDAPELNLQMLMLTMIIMRNATKQVEDFHKRGVLHLDIKPDNMYIDPNLKVLIFDFGVSMKLPPGKEEIKDSTLRGTPNYMARELQASMSLGEIVYTKKADIYSLGKSFNDILSAIFGKNLIPPYVIKNPNNKFEAEILADLGKIVNDMLRIKPEQRPTAKEVGQAFREIERKLQIVVASQLVKTKGKSSAEDALQMLRISERKNLTRPDAVKFLEQCGMKHSEALALVTPQLIKGVNSSSLTEAVQETEALKDKMEDTVSNISGNPEDPEYYIRTHRNDLNKALDLLEKQEGGKLSRKKALQFAAHCKETGLISDYRSAVAYITKKFK